MHVEEFAQVETINKVRAALDTAFDSMNLKILNERPFIKDRLLTEFTHEILFSCM